MEKISLCDQPNTFSRWSTSENLTHLIKKNYSRTSELLRRVGTVSARLGIEAYAVGGVVRDLLLGRPITDLDFVTVGTGTGIRLARSVGKELGGRMVYVYNNFGTAAVRIEDQNANTIVLEFVAARQESYRRTSRKPIVEDGTLRDDQHRRDFRINAMALHIAPGRFGDLIDPFDGRKDLQNKIIDTPLSPHSTFEDDPLRMIRAARFAAQLKFTIEDKVRHAMKAEAHRVDILSQERITEELQRIMASEKPSTGYRLLEQAGILRHFFRELAALKGVETIRGQRHKDNFYHTLQVLDNVATATQEWRNEKALWLRWAALLHDIAKPRVKRFVPGTGWTFHGHEDRGARMIPGVFRRLRLPMDERMHYVQKLVALHHRPVALVDAEVTDSAVRRLLFEAGDAIDDLMLLVRADITSKNPRRVQRYLAAFDRVEGKFAEVEARDQLRNFRPPIDGREIMETVGVKQGVVVGIIKETIREAILDGNIANDYEQAYALMMQIKDDALRRGALFDQVLRLLDGPERRAMGAIKDAIFHRELPDDHSAALVHLMGIKEKALHSG